MIGQIHNWPAGYSTQAVTVIQGEYKTASDPGVTLTTVLGSCVAVCLFDARLGVGGMNHYLLAESQASEGLNLKYGIHAMELLVNGLLKLGASRGRMQAKIFGGGNMTGRFADIGPRNVEFALKFLSEEGFPILARDVGGSLARRLNFHPATGQARVLRPGSSDEAVQVAAAAPQRSGGVTLF